MTGISRKVTNAQVQFILQENENLKKRLEQYQQAYDSLQHQVQLLLRSRYGKKSERMVDETNPQLELFPAEALADTTADESTSQDDETVEVPAHKRRSRGKKDTSKLPRKIAIIPVPADEMTCACGCQKKIIRYETKELLHYEPAKLFIIEQRREVAACSKGCEQSIKTAPAPQQVLPKVKVTESLLAYTIVSKLHHRQPLYHLEKYGDVAGLTRETMARWHIQLIEPLQPLFNLMKDEIIQYDIASIDATTLQVLNEPERAPETKSYLYCIRGGPPDKRAILYQYNAHLHKPFVDEWFEGFQGSVHMDADPFFETLLEDPFVFAANCNAHARRKFEPIAKMDKKKRGLACKAMAFYRALYRIERIAKNKKLSDAERFQLRLEKSKPLLEQFKRWLDDNDGHLLPNSPLGEAFRYCLNHWQGLTHFLSDGRIEIDNNLTEQEIKPIVIARKNFMFAYSVNGAHALCMHFSLIRSALLHKLNPYQYYVAVLQRLPHCESVGDYEKLLPWNIQLDDFSQ